MKPLIEVTEKALQEITAIREKKSIPDEYRLRIGIKGAGCAGVSYLLGFDLPRDRDDVFSIGNMEVIVDKKHALYLAGIKLDYVQENDAQGFVFQTEGS